MKTTAHWTKTVLWTGGLALLVTVAGGAIWTLLLLANLATTPTLPWAVVIMAPVLWSIWSYMAAKGLPVIPVKRGADICVPIYYPFRYSLGHCWLAYCL